MVGSPPTNLPPPNVEVLQKGTRLFRNHESSFGPSSFNPCMGNPTRFAPIKDAQGACVPSLYAATSPEAAAFETVFHDVLPGFLGTASVPLRSLHARSESTLILTRAIKIACLHAPDLRLWGLLPAELTSAPSRHYDMTARWAEAVHRHFADLDGLVWTSNKCDPDRCFVFFGDRVAETDLDCTAQFDLGAHGQARDRVQLAAERSGIILSL